MVSRTWLHDTEKWEYVFKGSFDMKENPIMILKMQSENSTYTLWFAYWRVVLEIQFCEFKMFPSKYLTYSGNFRREILYYLGFLKYRESNK